MIIRSFVHVWLIDNVLVPLKVSMPFYNLISLSNLGLWEVCSLSWLTQHEKPCSISVQASKQSICIPLLLQNLSLIEPFFRAVNVLISEFYSYRLFREDIWPVQHNVKTWALFDLSKSPICFFFCSISSLVQTKPTLPTLNNYLQSIITASAVD